MGGSRVSTNARLLLNLSVVWLLTGVWHGASWNFIVWGIYYLVFLVLEKMVYPNAVKAQDSSPFGVRAMWHIYTMIIVIFGWVLFRAPTLPDALSYMSSMLGMADNTLICDTFFMYLSEKRLYLIIGVIFSVSLAPFISSKLNSFADKKNLLRAVSVCADVLYPIVYTGIFVLSIAFLLKNTYNPFIYFNF